jgi:predicted transcriptional regulator
MVDADATGICKQMVKKRTYEECVGIVQKLDVDEGLLPQEEVPMPRYASESYAARAKRGRHTTTIVLTMAAKARLAELAEKGQTTKSAVVERLLMGDAEERMEKAREMLLKALES